MDLLTLVVDIYISAPGLMIQRSPCSGMIIVPKDLVIWMTVDDI